MRKQSPSLQHEESPNEDLTEQIYPQEVTFTKPNTMRFNRKILKFSLVAFIALLFLAVAGGFAINEPLPDYTTGPEADSLATDMLSAVGYEQWLKTNALTFTFAGRHHYLWDKTRNFARVEWGSNKVLIDLSKQTGVATQEGEPLRGEELEKAVQKAWSMWCNDSFWFCAPYKCFDPGTLRGLVKAEDGSSQLLVKYTSGGVTPGDAYLWILDENMRPTGWKMWTSIIPVGGVYSSWENWTNLKTGALIAQTHSTSSFTLEITDVQGAKDLNSLGFSVDPFAELLQN